MSRFGTEAKNGARLARTILTDTTGNRISSDAPTLSRNVAIPGTCVSAAALTLRV